MSSQVVLLDFNLDIRNLVRMKTFFTPFLENQTTKQGLVLDLSKVKTIDSMGHKTIQNLWSKLAAQQRTLALYTESAEFTEQIKTIHPEIRLIASQKEMAAWTALSAKAAASVTEMECPLCGNKGIEKQVSDLTGMEFTWEDDDFFPLCRENGVVVEYYRRTILLCTECLFASLYPEDFVHIQNEERHVPPLTDEVRMLLMRTTNRRRDLLKRTELQPEDLIRTREKDDYAMEYCCRLLAECMNAMIFDRSLNRFYEIGLATLLIYRYMRPGVREKGLLEAALQAFSNCIKNPPDKEGEKVFQSFYFSIVCAVLLGQKLDARQVLHRFEKNKQEWPGKEERMAFWYANGQKWYNKEVQKDASKFII
ncbi:MAG: hypothetical protein A2293_03285 [Elusimicrobia bacterium RIFOXYB2_FULL_49_7]|nr:MAG: hypothetical protein A2293_03285 [Elusimicrobia bacterium RIFOXYB2_FULL_49_7]